MIGKVAYPDQSRAQDTARKLVEFIFGVTGQDPSDDDQNEAAELVAAAARLDEILRKSRAHFSVNYQVDGRPFGFPFDDSRMLSRNAEDKSYDLGATPPAIVRMIISPGLVKAGTADGSNYDQESFLVKMTVFCGFQDDKDHDEDSKDRAASAHDAETYASGAANTISDSYPDDRYSIANDGPKVPRIKHSEPGSFVHEAEKYARGVAATVSNGFVDNYRSVTDNSPEVPRIKHSEPRSSVHKAEEYARSAAATVSNGYVDNWHSVTDDGPKVPPIKHSQPRSVLETGTEARQACSSVYDEVAVPGRHRFDNKSVGCQQPPNPYAQKCWTTAAKPTIAGGEYEPEETCEAKMRQASANKPATGERSAKSLGGAHAGTGGDGTRFVVREVPLSRVTGPREWRPDRETQSRFDITIPKAFYSGG